MKFDMHCHTREGSPDAKVSLVDYAIKLNSEGFKGMLITDHDSYNGYRAYKRDLKDFIPDDFLILKGIEYDTIDAGHIIVIMPTDVHLKILELRGLPIYVLIDIVHKHGGILGPAHPCGENNLSIFSTGIFRYHRHVAKQFDFIEGFNACEDRISNESAQKIAKAYGKTMFGGSDSHKLDNVGLAYTEFPEGVNITSEDDLIRYIKEGGTTTAGGSRYYGTVKVKLGRFNKILVHGFWFYNKWLGLMKHRKRFNELKLLKRYTDLTESEDKE